MKMRKKVSIIKISYMLQSFRRKSFLVLILLFTLVITKVDKLNAQGISAYSENSKHIDFQKAFDDTFFGGTQINPDTLPVSVKPKLLPDKMSLLERGVWGESGFLRWTGIASLLTPEVRKHELEIRRVMLSIHQIGGFTTLGLMLATCYYGQKIIDGGVDGRRNYENTKNTLVTATITSYSITALLSLLSPPPLIRRDEASTISTHKTLAWLHVAGMIVTPILGSLISRNHTFNMDEAHVHQISGYITTALFATSMIVVTF
jgi:hypothetical protein